MAPRRRLGLLTSLQGPRRARDDHARFQARDQDRRGRARRAARREPSTLGAPIRHEAQRADLRRPMGERLPHRPNRQVLGRRLASSTSATRSRPRCTRRSPATLAARGCGCRSPAPSSSTRWRRARRSGRRACRCSQTAQPTRTATSRSSSMTASARNGGSFHLGRRPTEFFSFVFPEHALRRGRNRVEVLEVVDGGHSRAAGRQSRRRAVSSRDRRGSAAPGACPGRAGICQLVVTNVRPTGAAGAIRRGLPVCRRR